MIVDFASYRDGLRVDGPADFSDALALARTAGAGFVWPGLYEPTTAEFDLVREEFRLHPLAVEDAVSAHQRPKLETYQDSLFVVLKTVGYDPAAQTVSTGELMLFVGDCFVITARHGADTPLARLRGDLEKQPDLLALGPAAVLYAVTVHVVDDYLEAAASLQSDLDQLEAEIFAPGRVPTGAAARIHALKRQVVALRRATGPLHDPMLRLARGEVPHVPAELQPYLRDVADRLVRVDDLVEGMDRLLSGILDANLAQVSVQQNDDARKMSAWAAVVAVPTLVAGLYGTRFDFIPELRPAWAYPVALGGMALVCGVLYRVFKRSGWL